MAEEDDPFAAFGDDSDSDSEDEHAGNETLTDNAMAASLRERANNQINSDGTSTANSTRSIMMKRAAVQHDVPISTFKNFNLPWPEPLYLGPISLVSLDEMGGGRGYVASKKLEPGTLVLVEEPMMTWSDEQLGKALDLISIRNIIEHTNAQNIVQYMEEFHPSKKHVDEQSTETDDDQEEEQVSGMMNRIRKDISPDQVLELVELAQVKGTSNGSGSKLDSTDILRLLLALRYNGLESGIYRNSAMLNHSCHPNCTKLMPAGDQHFSEVRVTRTVAEGEPLSISYLPNIMSHATRRKHLWDQHKFDIGSNYLKGDYLKMELVNGALPTSNVNKWDDENLTARIEKAIDDFQNLFNEYSLDIAGGTATPELWEHTKALEVSSLELYDESLKQLGNEIHILLIPCLSIHLEACQLVLKSPLSLSVQLQLSSRLVRTACKLSNLQQLLLGPDHFDLARSHLDMADGIAELLSRSPQHLIDLKMKELDSFQNWKALEQMSRREYNRVKALYPENVRDFISAPSM